ncbi:hypothetical protein [Parasphingorhabdus sp.]|uniref:hypothetical protein n=1 Tax=Parasphingorhabdus sp. TaxID=2709688 RepID=UPI0032631F83
MFIETFTNKVASGLSTLGVQVFSSGTLRPTTTVSGLAPDMIRYFELDFDIVDGISLKYTDSAIEIVSDWPEAYQKIAESMRVDNFPPHGTSHRSRVLPHWDSAKPNGYRDRSPLALRMPTNKEPPSPTEPKIEISERCLYVIKLASGREHSGIKWRYSTIFSPITVGEKGSIMDKLFSDTQLLYLKDGRLAPQIPLNDELPIGAKPYESTNWACFMFNCAEARNFYKDGKFVARFNIHVEINDKNDLARYIPIIIDPDVGHPGGNSGG